MIHLLFNARTKLGMIWIQGHSTVHLEKAEYDIVDGNLRVSGEEITRKFTRLGITDPKILETIRPEDIKTYKTWRGKEARHVPPGEMYDLIETTPVKFRATQWTLRVYE